MRRLLQFILRITQTEAQWFSTPNDASYRQANIVEKYNGPENYNEFAEAIDRLTNLISNIISDSGQMCYN